eukprot:1144163-Rhodomonas_salina.1
MSDRVRGGGAGVRGAGLRAAVRARHDRRPTPARPRPRLGPLPPLLGAPADPPVNKALSCAPSQRSRLDQDQREGSQG